MTAANDTATSDQVPVHAVRIVADDPAPLVACYDMLLGTSTPHPDCTRSSGRGPRCTCRAADATLSKKPYLRQRSTPPNAEGSSTSRRTTSTCAATCSGPPVHHRRRAVIAAVGALAATVADPDGRIINIFAPARGSHDHYGTGTAA